MRIGVIGLGDIAEKAYLPVLSQREDIELVICTRNTDMLNRLAHKYRLKEKVQTADELIEKKVDAVFISAATDAHAELAQKLLKNDIPIYIDKPISLDFHESQSIAELAKETGNLAMVGFNRRFAPRVSELKDHGKPDLLFMQKNRFAVQDPIRLSVAEDFIHVVDTLRFLMDTEATLANVSYKRDGDKLNHLVIQLTGESCTAIGVMNRNGGVNEEIIEYSTGHDKYVVDGLVETTHYHDKNKNVSTFNAWDTTLYKRGFYSIVDHFLDCVKNNLEPDQSIADSLVTHQLCEEIVKKIDSGV